MELFAESVFADLANCSWPISQVQAHLAMRVP
jgi:hypothetical protein